MIACEVGGGSIHVRRGRGDSGMMREIVVDVDGKESARLAQGAEVRIDVTPGHHVVQARMDWCTSAPLTMVIAAGQPAVVEVALPFNSAWRAFTAPKRALSATLVE